MFKMKKIQAALAGVALVAALPLSVMAQGKEPVKVGLVSSKSGVFAEQGEEVMRAIKFAIEEANSKGVSTVAELSFKKRMMKAHQTQVDAWPKNWHAMVTTCSSVLFHLLSRLPLRKT